MLFQDRKGYFEAMQQQLKISKPPKNCTPEVSASFHLTISG
jgi:hypothetical protein